MALIYSAIFFVICNRNIYELTKRFDMAKGEETKMTGTSALSFDDFKKIVLDDYRTAYESREASLIGRKEVLTGKAKFGIFGDGKEVAQLAMAKAFREGDFRSGYYRDQTFMFACGTLTIQQWFAGLYAHADVEADPSSAGRQMNGHFATRSLNVDGTWKDLTKIKNSSSDISPTGGQMPRLLGLAMASKYYRINPDLQQGDFLKLSVTGNEIAFGTIGDASTSEGLFWETINAAGVTQVPMLISVWDDGHGISVPKKYQTTKENISELLKGFQRDDKFNGYEIFKVKGWDYPALCETYEKAAAICREQHVPVLVHVEEMTQPQGHSTSGSHERYKSKERLQWEQDFDPIKKMKDWMIASSIATAEELEVLENEARQVVKNSRNAAWNAYLAPIKEEVKEVCALLDTVASESSGGAFVQQIRGELSAVTDPIRKDIFSSIKRVLRKLRFEDIPSKQKLADWLDRKSVV